MAPLARREAIDGFLFISPWLIGFVLLTAGPMIASFVLIFVDWDLLSDPMWGGLVNVQRLTTDRLVGLSLYNTAYYTLFSVPIRLALALAISLGALAEDKFPSRTVTLTVGFAPGGGTDTAARIIAKKLSDTLGVAVVVENKAGAGGNIAAQQIATAAPDGYTISLSSVGPLTVSPASACFSASKWLSIIGPGSITATSPWPTM